MLKFLLIILNFYVAIGKIVVIENPGNAFGLENQKIVLRCHVHGIGNITVQWLKGKSALQTNLPERKIHAENQADGSIVSFLTIHLARHTEGEYQCNATDSDGWILSQKADVRIAFLDEHFIQEPQDKIVSVGETVLLECRPPKGLPKPTVKWTKDNNTVVANERTQILENGNLRIDRITWKDSGVYMCVAESFAFHRHSSGATLSVRQRPYFVSSPLSQSVPIHSSFELTCSAAGEPLPVIVWRRDPPFLEIPFERTRLLARGTLQFYRVQLEDAGDYVCRAISSAGIIEAIAQVNVVSPPGLVKTPPYSVTALEGTRVELPCKALGSPIPDIRWMRHNPETYLVADAGNSVDRVVMTPSGTLLIYAARPDDSSTYECRASSPAGLTRSVTLLSVQSNPSLEPARVGAFSANRIFLPPAAQRKTVRIICEFPNISVASEPSPTKSGKPTTIRNDKASILWLVDGKSLRTRFPNANKTYIEHDGSLIIHNFELPDVGNYTCTVFNHISRRYSTWNFELLNDIDSKNSVYSPNYSSSLPRPPKSLTVTGIGDTWMSFQWTDDNEGYAYVPVYKLYYLPIVSGQSSGPTRKDSHPVNVNQGPGRMSPKLDIWRSTPEVVRNTQTRISNLLPNTGYWIEVRKINHLGSSSGFIYPKILYTLKKPNTAMFIGENNDSLSFDQRADRTHSLVHSNTAVDYQEMSTSFQSISFSEIKVRSLTTTEILTSWTTRSAGNILNQIDGFRMNIKPVPMTRCLVTATSGSLDQLSSFPYTDRGKVSVELDGAASPDTYMSPVHCSLSSDALIQQIIRMSNTVANHPVNHIEPSIRSPEAQTVIVGRSISSVNPTTKAVGGGLLPFTCYEVDVEAFRDDIVYGRLWSRTSRSTLALTLDSSPSYSPHLVNAHWLFDVGADNKSITDSSAAKFNVVRLAWKPLELRMAHGALIGYVIHFLANETQQSRTIHVPPDAVTRDIFGLSPHVEYTIYLAGVTCRGEGVRGAGFRLPPAISLWRKTYASDLSQLDGTGNSPFYFPSWAYGIIVGIVLFWIGIGLLAPLLVRHSSSDRVVRGPDGGASFATRNKSAASNHQGPSCLAFPLWHWCVWSTSVPSDRTTEAKNQSSLDGTVTRGTENGADYSFTHASSENQVEMTTLLQRTSNGQTASSSSERITNDAPDKQLERRRAAFLRASRSQSIPKLSTESSKHDFDASNLLTGDDAEVYANSDPSVISHPNGSSPPNTASVVSSQNCQMVAAINPSLARPQLPDSINIPFPLPPSYQSNGLVTVSGEPSDTITNPNPISDYIDSTYSQGAQHYPNVPNGGHDDVVPPYASCTVLPVSKPNFPGSFSRLPPGSTLQRGNFFVQDVFQANSIVGPVAMSQSIGSSGGLTSEDPVFVDLRSDRPPVMHRWPIYPGNPRVTLGSNYLAVSSSPHSIPPPPEYPPPPLPTGSNDWIRPEQQLSTTSCTNGYSGANTLNHDDRGILLASGVRMQQPGSNLSTPYYASGGIYAQTEASTSPVPYTLTRNAPHPLFAAQSPSYFRSTDTSYGAPGLIRQNFQVNAFAAAPSALERLQPGFNPRSHRSHSSGMRSGEGSSSGRSTTSGLGSGSTKFTSGGRLPDASASGCPIGGSISGSDSSTASGARAGLKQQQFSPMVTPTSLVTASDKYQMLQVAPSSGIQTSLASVNGLNQLHANAGPPTSIYPEVSSSHAPNGTTQPLSHSTGLTNPNYPDHESLIMCNAGVSSPHDSAMGACVLSNRITSLNNGSV